MLTTAAEVAQLLDPDENTGCSLCGSSENRCKGCVELLERRRNVNAVARRLHQLGNKKQPDKAQGRGTGKKKPLNWASIEVSCSKANESQPNAGWENWRRELLEKAHPSQQEKDAVLLIKAFNNPLLGWVLLQYSEVGEWISRPSKYKEILLYIMKSTDDPERPGMVVQSSHKVTPDVPATQLIGIETADTEEHNPSSLPTQSFGMIQSSNAQTGQAGERDNDAHTQVAPESVQRNGKRPNGEGIPGRKRVCLQSANDTTQTECAISTSVPGPETPASIGPHSTIHSPMLGPSAHLSPNFEYLGQTGCTEEGDRCLVYSWPAYSAVRFLLDENTPLWTDGKTYEGRISLPSLERLPNGSLADIVTRSKTWEKQSQGCESSVCFKICLPRSPTILTKPMGTIFCTVPRDEAPGISLPNEQAEQANSSGLA